MSGPTAADLDAAQCILDSFQVSQLRADWGAVTPQILAEMIARRMEPERAAAARPRLCTICSKPFEAMSFSHDNSDWSWVPTCDCQNIVKMEREAWAAAMKLGTEGMQFPRGVPGMDIISRVIKRLEGDAEAHDVFNLLIGTARTIPASAKAPEPAIKSGKPAPAMREPGDESEFDLEVDAAHMAAVAAASTSEPPCLIGIPEQFAEKPTKTGGTRYGIKVSGVFVNTFDKNIRDFAADNAARKMPVKIYYTDGKWGKDATEIKNA